LYALDNSPSLLNNLQRIHLNDLDTYLCFKVSIRCANLKLPLYSDYQQFLHKKITELHDSGLGYRRISYWLNENGYKTARGKMFKNTHVHSILKKKRLSEERFSKEYENELGDMSMKFIDRTLINSD